MGHRKPGTWLRLLVAGTLALAVAGCPPKMGDAEKLERDGNDYMKAEKYEKALAAFNQALELKPGTPGLLVNRGNARMMLEDSDGALADHDEAIATDPYFALGYANRGILKDRTGDVDGAIVDYAKALELDPELGEGPSLLKRILYNPPTDTIKDRLEYLQALEKAGKAPPASE